MSATLPPDPVAVLRAERTLRNERRWQEAEALLAAAVQVWPDDEALLVDYGLIAHEQMHWADMAERFAVVRERCPGHVFGYSRTGEALRWLCRFDEAEPVISAGLTPFPDVSELLVQWVLVACDRAERGSTDWRSAEARGQEFIARVPDKPESYRYAAEPYLRQRRWADAEVAIAEGLHRLGPEPSLVLHFAELAVLRQEWTAAARRWAAVIRHLPDSEAAYLGRAQALRELDRLTELEALVGAAAVQFPDSLPVAREHAWAATLRRDWQAALTRWRAVAARTPDDPAVRERVVEAELQAGRQPPPVLPSVLPSGTPTDLAQLLLRFEPLGEDCEFGLIQRHLGLEPLALFRFAGITLDHLVAALDVDLAGIGSAEFTHVFLRDGVEYMINDTRFGLGMHSFTGPAQVSAEQFAASAQRRLQFLARKLLDDLRQPTKLFVRTSRTREPLERIMRLSRALTRHGPATLLFVQESEDPQRIGQAEWLAPGVIQGWIERFSITEPLDAQWHALCRAAHVLWVRGAPADLPRRDRPEAPEPVIPFPTLAVVQPIAIEPLPSFGFGASLGSRPNLSDG